MCYTTILFLKQVLVVNLLGGWIQMPTFPVYRPKALLWHIAVSCFIFFVEKLRALSNLFAFWLSLWFYNFLFIVNLVSSMYFIINSTQMYWWSASNINVLFVFNLSSICYFHFAVMDFCVFGDLKVKVILWEILSGWHFETGKSFVPSLVKFSFTFLYGALILR